ncbi:MAG TPA: tRNA uridine-5-carboxymethylaminomethyl(34) synthesis GTPase MnmE [Thermoanaerobaculia bacterium]|nr:tRNA uridine-5-carboxymethylaminomethyl(34) synthesis GTPase MnmE [Thermoanaerobaculia bacterium]
MSATDTIVAPATPVGRSALAIVRIDGPGSAAMLSALTGRVVPEERMAVHTYVRNIDDCVAIRYAAPRSFTGNDLVELTLHGNPLIVQQVIDACVDLGARIAEPGEFTERAVLNGKLDLVQAESIADLVNARTPLQAKLSLHNVDGLLSGTATAIRENLLQVIARLEAALDFSEEGYEFIRREEARTRINSALDDVREIAATFRRGRATQAGIAAVILGKPNAGKSTLLNRLVGSDRAIVTPIPGTTRDIVRETIEIGGLPVTLADTAGLRDSADVVESIGVDRARDAARFADIILYLIDATVGMDDDDRAELARLASQVVIVVYTKRDRKAGLPNELAISALTGQGMNELLVRLDSLVREQFAVPEESPAIVNERQLAAVNESAAALERALQSLDAGANEELVVVDLYAAANALASLTGGISNEDVLAEIFAKFCIGK